MAQITWPAVVALACATVAAPPQPPDFAGEWKRTGGAAAPALLTIRQDATAVTVTTAGFPAAVYRFDGTETSTVDRPPVPPGSEVVRRFRSKWDGPRLVTTITTLTTVDRHTTIAYTQETMSLEGGGTLAIETRRMTPIDTPRGAPPPGLALPSTALAVHSQARRTTYQRLK